MFSEKEVARRISDGDADAVDALVEHFESRIYSRALLLSASRETASQVLEDVFLRLFERLVSGEELVSIEHFVDECTVERSLALDELCSAGVQIERDSVESSLAEHEQSKDSRFIEAALRLPKAWRTIFVLSDVCGMSVREITSMLELPRATIRSRLHQARLMLCRMLEREHAADRETDLVVACQREPKGSTLLAG